MQQSKALKAVISVVLLAGGGLVAEAHAQTTLAPVTVTGTAPGSSPGGSWGGGFGGGASVDDPGNSDSSGGPEDPMCPVLRLNKPAGCPGPIPVPSGAAFGADRFQAGSALDRAIIFAGRSNTNPVVAATVRQALAAHTDAFAQITITAPTANGALLQSMSLACDQQSQIFDTFPQISPRPWQAESDCTNVIGLLLSESGTPFLPWFVAWLETKSGIKLSDFIPQTFINWATPSNSLSAKFDLVTADAKCSAWWKEVTDRRC